MNNQTLNQPLKVFIVEDEVLIAMDMEMMVEDFGHVVLGIADSFEGVQKSRKILEADIVLLDYNLATAFTGSDVCRYLRTQKKDLVILFVSANTNVIDLKEVDGDGLVDKPIGDRLLGQTLAYIHEGIRNPPPTIAIPTAVQFADKFKTRIMAS
jgi:CheY-like chemotaxis protein